MLNIRGGAVARHALIALALVLTCMPAFAQASSSTLLDLNAVLQPLVSIVFLVIIGLAGQRLPALIDAFEKRTGIHLTEQQRQTMLGSVQTAAGIIETQIDQGLLQVAHVRIDNPVVLAQARAAMNAVPQAAAALGMTTDSVARMIVGAVDTGSRATPTASRVEPPVLAPNKPAAA